MGSSLNEEDDIMESPLLLSQNQMDIWMETQNGVINETYYEKR